MSFIQSTASTFANASPSADATAARRGVRTLILRATSAAATTQGERLIDDLRQNHPAAGVTHLAPQAARLSQKTAFSYRTALVDYGKTGQMFTAPGDRHPVSDITGRIG
ncbi:hypothetical protein [Pararhodobacter oceanensis]|uniref:Uncharacterized protein n=1 Tax=Pararhodobacter oceanensis TaxID=2172121 RepID=A0A2T8HY80_9RHOB|nr:hypothetical protein [Pararhodobacter oceanensis]PVH30349.1 hypothetical protein DDE20_01995 [Pararhodobacter oceanensis]